MGVKVKVSRKGVFIPEELFREMMGAYVKMEWVLASLETLADKEALRARLRRAEKTWLRASTWNVRWMIWREF